MSLLKLYGSVCTYVCPSTSLFAVGCMALSRLSTTKQRRRVAKEVDALAIYL